MTLVATVAAPGREGLDFFPLTVDYREKFMRRKFPRFIKREGRPEHEGDPHLADHRPADPAPLPRGYREEVQIQAGRSRPTAKNDPDIISMIGASATLILARVPFLGPIGAIRLGRVEASSSSSPTPTR